MLFDKDKDKLIAQLEGENAFLREQVKELQDKLMALADTRAYLSTRMQENTGGDKDEYYGGEGDTYVGYNDYGELIRLEKPKNDE